MTMEIRAGALATLLLAAGCATYRPAETATHAAIDSGMQTFVIDRSSIPRTETLGVCQNTTGAACQNTISISPDCVKDPTRIQLQFDTLKIDVQRATPIQWRIVSADWVFDGPGIEFYPPATDMMDLGGGGNGQVWTQVDKALTNKVVFGYRIRVRNPRLGVTCERDPVVVNDW